MCKEQRGLRTSLLKFQNIPTLGINESALFRVVHLFIICFKVMDTVHGTDQLRRGAYAVKIGKYMIFQRYLTVVSSQDLHSMAVSNQDLHSMEEYFA